MSEKNAEAAWASGDHVRKIMGSLAEACLGHITNVVVGSHHFDTHIV